MQVNCAELRAAHREFMPGGIGYYEAKAHFEECVKEQEAGKSEFRNKVVKRCIRRMRRKAKAKEVMRVAETSFYYNDEEFRNCWCFTTSADPTCVPNEEVIAHIASVIESQNYDDTWEDENEEPLPIPKGLTAYQFAQALVNDKEGSEEKYGVSWDFRLGDEWSDDPDAPNCF